MLMVGCVISATLNFVRHLSEAEQVWSWSALVDVSIINFCLRIEDVSRETGGEGVSAPLPLRVLFGVAPSYCCFRLCFLVVDLPAGSFSPV